MLSAAYATSEMSHPENYLVIICVPDPDPKASNRFYL